MLGSIAFVKLAALIAYVMYRLQLFGLQGFIHCLQFAAPWGASAVMGGVPEEAGLHFTPGHDQSVW